MSGLAILEGTQWGPLLVGAAIGALMSVIAAVLLQPKLEEWRFRALARFPPWRTSIQPLDGIWKSEYEYETSDHEEPQLSEHFVVVRESGRHVRIQGLRKPEGSALTLRLVRQGSVLTGEWRERTSKDTLYHGAIQLKLNSPELEMKGTWVGFARDDDFRTGPWKFTLIQRDRGFRERRHFKDRTELA